MPENVREVAGCELADLGASFQCTQSHEPHRDSTTQITCSWCALLLKFVSISFWSSAGGFCRFLAGFLFSAMFCRRRFLVGCTNILAAHSAMAPTICVLSDIGKPRGIRDALGFVRLLRPVEESAYDASVQHSPSFREAPLQHILSVIWCAGIAGIANVGFAGSASSWTPGRSAFPVRRLANHFNLPLFAASLQVLGMATCSVILRPFAQF